MIVGDGSIERRRLLVPTLRQFTQGSDVGRQNNGSASDTSRFTRNLKEHGDHIGAEPEYTFKYPYLPTQPKPQFTLEDL